MCLAACIACLQDAQPELKIRQISAEGLRLAVPAGWRTPPSTDPRIVLQALGEETAGGIRPQLLFFHTRPTDPITFERFKHEVRKQVEKDVPGFALDREQDVRILGSPASRIEYRGTLPPEQEGRQGTPFEGVRAGVLLAPRRFLLIELRYPSGEGAKYRALFDRVTASLGLFRPEPDAGARKRLEAFGELMERLGSFPAAVRSESHMTVQYAQKTVGSFRILVEDREVEGRPGYSIEHELRVEADEGQSRTTVRGFVGAGMGYQRVEIERVVRRGEEEMKFSATAVLEGRRVHVRRTILGENQEESLEVPEGTILGELLAVLVLRAVDYAPADFSVWVLSAFDREPFDVRIEIGKARALRTKLGRLECWTVMASREGAGHTAYRIASDKRIVEIREGPMVIEPAGKE